MHNTMIETIATATGLKFVIPALSPFVLFAAGVLDETTLIPIAFVGTIAGVIWYLSARFTRIEASQELANKLAEVNAAHQLETSRLTSLALHRVESKLHTLPCSAGQICKQKDEE
jgi:hypothetical protein